jgi:putative redox protein
MHSSGVDGAGTSPMQAVLAAVGGCGAMDVISILRKMRQEVESYEIRVSATRASEHPKVFTGIDLRHIVSGLEVNEANVARAIQLTITRYCPVYAMLAPVVPIRVSDEVRTPAGTVEGRVEPEPLALGDASSAV